MKNLHLFVHVNDIVSLFVSLDLRGRVEGYSFAVCRVWRV